MLGGIATFGGSARVLSAQQMGAGRIIARSRHRRDRGFARAFGAMEILTGHGDHGLWVEHVCNQHPDAHVSPSLAKRRLMEQPNGLLGERGHRANIWRGTTCCVSQTDEDAALLS